MIYTRKNHGLIEKDMPPDKIRNAEEGFITDDGTFVSREEAAQIAFDCGQIERSVPKLFSFDLKLQ